MSELDIHALFKDVFCWTPGNVVGVDLNHELVDILDSIFELLCQALALYQFVDLKLTFHDIVVCLADWCHGFMLGSRGTRWSMYLISSASGFVCD